jgi:serine/threonine-protein kinase
LIAERYLVDAVLGNGGMGVVWAGTHVLLGTPVAIKLIHSELKDDHEAVHRFVNEARAAAALRGEHIARVFDVGLLPSGEPFLVMERLEGMGLDQRLQECGVLAFDEALSIVLQVCEGLAEAHEAGIVHRDIKPANLFLARRPDGGTSVKILDFGIAKQRLSGDSPALTNPGKSLGSPWYMSPEQMLRPAEVDQRADVWSIGVLLYELLTGCVPFDGDSVPQVCANVLATAPRRPSELRADVGAELDRTVLRCLEKEPERRFASVNELARALLPFTGAGSSPLPPAPTESSSAAFQDSLTPPPTSRESLSGKGGVAGRRHRARPIVVALLAIACLFTGGYAQYRDPTLVRRAVGVARIDLPGDPQLSSGSPEAAPERAIELPGLLQTLHLARAVAEPKRVNGSVDSAPRPLRYRHGQQRAQSHSAESATWGRLTEERYGL